MKKPRLIYYNDAHHFHAKRIDPPLNKHKMHWPVDEVVGTGVELLVLGLGYGDVYFHDSKVGRTVGEKQEVWESFIDWRIMRMVKNAREMALIPYTNRVTTQRRERRSDDRSARADGPPPRPTAPPPGSGDEATTEELEAAESVESVEVVETIEAEVTDEPAEPVEAVGEEDEEGAGS